MHIHSRKHPKWAEVFRFGVVGCIAVAVQYGVYGGLLWLLPYNVAYTIGYLISFAVNYWLTTSFTFPTKRNKRNGLGFILCHVVNYLLQVGLLNVFIRLGCPELWVPIPVFAICVPTNFILVRLVMKRGAKSG
jgi:putative flippase GtrA